LFFFLFQGSLPVFRGTTTTEFHPPNDGKLLGLLIALEDYGGEIKVIDYLFIISPSGIEIPPSLLPLLLLPPTQTPRAGSLAFCHSQEEEPGCQRPKFRCWFDSLLLQIAPAICIIPTTLMKSNPIVPIITNVVVVVVIRATHENFIQRKRRRRSGGGCNPSGRKQRGLTTIEFLSGRSE
jgi:hypothetical protein